MGDLTSPPEPANRVQTPLTDAAMKRFITGITIRQPREEQFHDFARQLETDRAELIEAMRRVIKVSDDFVAETGLRHGDPLTDAVDDARALLSRLSPAPQPTEGGKG